MRPATITPRDLRIEIAAHWAPRRHYELAAKIPIHPVTLGALLSGRLPLTQSMADRILTVLHTDRQAARRW